jgi:hypothetical protein
MVYRSLGFSLLLSGLIFGISYAFYRSSRKAGIFTTLFIVGFFIYGFIYNQLETLFYKDMWPFAHIHRFLVVTYAVLYLVLFVIFYRSRRPHHNVNYALNVFVIGVFVLNAIMGMSSSNRQGRMDTGPNPFIGSLQQGIADSLKSLLRPDVYYIILDGYASEKVLEKFYGATYDGLYQYLRINNFYVADSSRTNYPTTAPSLSSSLNAQYIDSIDIKSRQTLIPHNLVSHVFKKAGYRVVNIESGYAVTEHLAFSDKTIGIKGLNEFENRLLELTILRLDDVLGFTNHLRLKSQLDRLPLIAKEKGPKFSFIHIVSPHPPFVVDSVGNRHLRNSLSDMAWEPRQDYAQQLQYVSKKVMELITLLQRNKKNPPIIILQSDHGPWLNSPDPKEVYQARSQILNAYFVPPAFRAKLYPTITPVNSFRLLFSELFKLDFPLLPDRPVSYDFFLNDPTFKKYAD